jgi:hypothetical protein
MVCLGRHKTQRLLPQLVSVRDLEKSDPPCLPFAFAAVGIVKLNWQMTLIIDHCDAGTRTTTDV